MRNEELISLAQATQIIPGHPHLSTLHRWRMRGIKGIKLETVTIGGRRYTSREAVERFIDATTAAADHQPISVRSSSKRRREVQAATGRLKESGILPK